LEHPLPSPGVGAEAESKVRGKVVDPDGRTVILTERAWRHICQHVGMERYERAIMAAVTHPDDRHMDIRPGRERFFAKEAGPTRWLRVVVDFSDDPGEIVTAFGHENEP